MTLNYFIIIIDINIDFMDIIIIIILSLHRYLYLNSRLIEKMVGMFVIVTFIMI